MYKGKFDRPQSFKYYQSRNRTLFPSQAGVERNVTTYRDTTHCEFTKYPQWKEGEPFNENKYVIVGKCAPGFRNAVTPQDVKGAIISAVTAFTAAATMFAILTIHIMLFSTWGIFDPFSWTVALNGYQIAYASVNAALAAAIAVAVIIMFESITCRRLTNTDGSLIDGLSDSSIGIIFGYFVGGYGGTQYTREI